MTLSDHPDAVIAAHRSVPEMTLKVMVLSVVLAAVLATSNAYIALKIGMLTSASIPAAIISMAVLRWFKQANILENNLVQTCASAGEAVAGGVVYTVPALIIIHYWQHFDYFTTMGLAFLGGLLGVFFSIPLRSVLMTERHLHYPEGRAIAAILQMNAVSGAHLSRCLLQGGLIGSVVELLQSGCKVLSSQWQVWFRHGSILWGGGIGFSTALLGAGYLVGFPVGMSLMLGGVVGWLLGVPLTSLLSHTAVASSATPSHAVMQLWGDHLSYMGIGAMLFAGVMTLVRLLKPFYQSLRASLRSLYHVNPIIKLPRTERDIPLLIVLFSVLVLLAMSVLFLHHTLSQMNLRLDNVNTIAVLTFTAFYLLIVGFIFSAITGYFSGLVGVSASPGSAIMIATVLLAAFLLRGLLLNEAAVLNSTSFIEAAAFVIMVASLVMAAAAIANDNIQDLKVGHLIGATPWKQQVMLLLGVVIAALIIPPVMELLFNVYGIADVLPRAGMDPTQTLAAPPAALMAAMTQGVFNHDLPWGMFACGMGLVIGVLLLQKCLVAKHTPISIIAFAVGIYLPLSSTTPLFLGSLFAYFMQRALQNRKQAERRQQQAMLLASGLVAGAALMDVLLALPLALTNNPNLLRLAPESWQPFAAGCSGLMVLGLAAWAWHRLVKCSA